MQVLPLEDVASVADVFIVTCANKDIISKADMTRMKPYAVLLNMGPCKDAIDMGSLHCTESGVTRARVNQTAVRYSIPHGPSVTSVLILGDGVQLQLGRALAHYSCSYTCMVSQIDAESLDFFSFQEMEQCLSDTCAQFQFFVKALRWGPGIF